MPSKFGGIEETSAPTKGSSRFGGVPVVEEVQVDQAPTQREVIAEALTAAQQRPGISQALQALFTPVMAAPEIAKGIYNIGKEGISGAVDIIGGKGSTEVAPMTAQEMALNAVLGAIPGLQLATPRQRRDIAQTAIEVVPRMVFEGAQGAVALANQPDTAVALTNPIAAALKEIVEGSTTPSEAEIQRAVSGQQLQERMAAIGEKPIVPEIIGETSIGAARAAPLVASIPGVAGTVKTGLTSVASAFSKLKGRISPSLTESASSAFNVPLAEAEQLIARSVPIVKDIGKGIPKNAKGALQISKVGRAELYDQSAGFLKQADAQDLRMKGDLGIEAVTAEISAIPTLTAEEAKVFIRPYQRYAGDIVPIEGQKLLTRLNDELILYFEKEGVSQRAARANPEIAAKIAFRDSLSDQLDDIVKGVSRKDISPFRDIGGLIEFESNLAPRLSELEMAVAAQKTGIDRRAKGLPLGRTEAAARTGRAITRPFAKSQVERLDNVMDKIFREAPSKITPAELPEGDVVRYLSPYTKTPEAIESAIEKLVRSYPKNIRDNPSYAKSLAEAELSGRATPLP